MTRGVGETEVIETLPELVVAVFGLFSHLADPWFVFGTVALFYLIASDWWDDTPRQTGVMLMSLAVCGLAATLLGKVVVGVPRPPAAATPATPPSWFPESMSIWFRAVTTSTGFGFPSGHAIAATVLYGGAAFLLDTPFRTLRRGLAAALISLVSLSRVVIQVHYLVDIVMGVILGGIILWLIVPSGARVSGGDPTIGFVLAGGLAVAAVCVAAFHGYDSELTEALIALGIATGGGLGWQVCNGGEPPLQPGTAAATVAVGGGVGGVAYLIGSDAGMVISAGAVTAGIVSAPSILTRL